MSEAEPQAARATPAATPKRRGPRPFDIIMLVGGFVLLGWVISRFPLEDISGAITRMGLLVFLSPLAAFGWFACNSTALYYILDRKVPWGQLYYNRLVGDGFNNLLPLAGLGGEPFKLAHLSTYVDRSRALCALIQDRMVDNSVGLISTACCVLLATTRDTLPPALRTAFYGFAAVAFVVAFVVISLLLTSLPGKLSGRLGKLLGGGEIPAPLSPGVVGRAVFFYAGGRIFGLLQVAYLLWLLDVPVTVVDTAFADGLLNVAGFIGFAIPQGIGVYEGTTVYLFELLQQPGPLGVAYAVARRGRLLFMSLVGVGLFLVVRTLRLRGTTPVPVKDDHG